MAKKYEIVQKDSEYLFLRDININSYCKVEHLYIQKDLPEMLKVENKPFFNYILSDNNPNTVIFGVPFKNGSRSPTSTVDKFPSILRQASYKLLHPNHYPDSIPLKFFHLDTGKEVECGKIMDLGDITINKKHSERKSIRQVTKFCLKNSYPFVCVGGDHSYSYDVVATLGTLNRPIVILDIDAHNDLHGTSDNLDHGNVFLHIAQLPFIKAIIQLGSRGFRTINQIIEHPKVIQIPKEKFSTDVLEYWLKKFEGCANYLSVDLDSLDPQYFPYVDFGVPGGFSKIELLTIINMIFNSGAVIGADIVEGVGGGNITRGDYDIPLEILISILSNFFNIQKGGINNNG